MKSLALIFLLCGIAAAQVVTVHDTLWNPDGVHKYSGQLIISWPVPFTGGDGHQIPAGPAIQVTVTNGALNVPLEANTTATPTGTYFSVQYRPTGSAAVTETWIVPCCSTPVNLSAVRVAIPPTPSFVIALTQLAQGGATPGQALVWNGTAWAPGTVALPDIIVAGTNTKITYNAKGLITSTAQAQFTDIGGSLGVGQTPLTTSQDILYRNGGGVLARLPIVSVNTCLGNTAGAWASIVCNGTVINDATLTANQLVVGNGTTHITVGNLSGDVATSGGLAATLATVNSGPGACGDSTHVCQLTTNGKGLVIAQAAVAIAKTGTSFITWGSIANGACSSSNVTVTGATAGAAVAPQWPGNFPASFIGTMVVDTTSDVLVTICNLSGGPVTPSGGLYGASVLQ